MKRIDRKKIKKQYKDIIIIFILLFASYQMLNDVFAPLIEAKKESSNLNSQITKLKEKNKDLENALNQSEKSPSIEKGYMRERFHMSEKDELIFVFPDDK